MKLNQAGFTLLELLLTVTVLGVLLAITIPAYYSYLDRADRAAIVSDARSVYRGFMVYFIEDPDNSGGFPFQTSAPAFNKTTFYPLMARTIPPADDGGNFIDILSVESLKRRIINGSADSYDSPDIVPNDNATFYITFRMLKDPQVRYIVAQTAADILDENGNPIVTGKYLDGIFVYINGELQYL
ncbi:MAG: prepilin-type N-terminal cleavage/methylation domain-containing protein [Deltaproteobacteria bacterium]|nr:prepilin-type N-terminal cleavage/methylation domain-containing protein [Deltaproteobacteria bacterium]